MTNKRYKSAHTKSLFRQEVKKRLVSTTRTHCSEDTPEKILHELQVHQIELEIQNESLSQATPAKIHMAADTGGRPIQFSVSGG